MWQSPCAEGGHLYPNGAQGIQSFTEACARLELAQQRDSLLRNLNHLCISVEVEDIMSDDGSTGSGADAGRCTRALCCSSLLLL